MTERRSRATAGSGRPVYKSNQLRMRCVLKIDSRICNKASVNHPFNHRTWWYHFVEQVFKKSTDTGSIHDHSIRCLWERFCIPYEEVSLSKTPKPELAPEASSVCEHACVVITAYWMAVNVSVNGCKQTGDTPSAQRYLEKQHIGTFS